VIKPKGMTLEEMDAAIFNCYREFYMSKMHEMLQTTDEFKKDYLLKAMRLMMSNSFIKKKMGMQGDEMPDEIKEIIATAIGLGL
jgi:anaerobic magnesium-protoporphyrin IX monomethyl ester cyclase